MFGELEKGRVVQKGVYAKMARGEMIRYMAARNVRQPEEIREFCLSGYRFREELSSEKEYIFVREKIAVLDDRIIKVGQEKL